MKANELASLAALGLGVALLLWLLVSGFVSKRRAFPEGVGGPVQASGRRPPMKHVPDPRYFIGLWAIMFALGASRSFVAGGVLAAIGALALLLAYARSGVVISDTQVVFGTLQRAVVDIDAIGAVVATPRSSFGKSFGVFGVADANGTWLAAIRYNTLIAGPQAVADLIDRAGLEPDTTGKWARSGVAAPRIPLPFLGM